MSFWLNETRASLLLRKFSTTMRAAVFIAACSSLYAIWFYGIYVPLRSDIKKNNQAIKKNQQLSENALPIKVVTSHALLSEHHDLAASMQKKWTKNLDELTSLFVTHGIACKKISIQKVKHRHALQKKKFIYSYTGDYKKIVNFLADVGEKLPNVRVARLSLKRSEDEGLCATMHCSIFNL